MNFKILDILYSLLFDKITKNDFEDNPTLVTNKTLSDKHDCYQL